MTRKYRLFFSISFLIILALLFAIYFYYEKIAVLDPKGIIGLKERDLIFTSLLMMLVVVLPVFVLTLLIASKYRASNKKAQYVPKWDNSHLIEFIWWTLPCLIILGLSILTWYSSYDLDPFRPIESDKKTKTIQVVALQWKWLFIYPEENIATVNYFEIPKDVPIRFEITADAPMNSFWIPQLGGQIYAMPGMQTELNLVANSEGSFRGSSANLSGAGFSGMYFTVKSSNDEDYAKWVESVKQSSQKMNQDEYNKLVAPSENHPGTFYTLEDPKLFHEIVMKYMKDQ
jgi:cytochrome o ubiquinol oxidase subunit II